MQPSTRVPPILKILSDDKYTKYAALQPIKIGLILRRDIDDWTRIIDWKTIVCFHTSN